MESYQHHLIKLLELTEEVYLKAKAVDPNMENNDVDQIQEILALVEKRQIEIQHLSNFVEQKDFFWREEDRFMITKMESYENVLPPLVDNLYKSFLTQLNRVSQTKEMSKKYRNVYQTTATEGSFFDKRK